LRAQLEELGYDDVLPPENSNIQYAFITDQLLTTLGVERVLTDIVAPNVKRQFSSQPSALDFLRAHWQSGGPPKWQTLLTFLKPRPMEPQSRTATNSKSDLSATRENFNILDVFLQFNIQHRYVHGWTAFAGVWFEEIEPLLGRTGS